MNEGLQHIALHIHEHSLSADTLKTIPCRIPDFLLLSLTAFVKVKV